MTADECQSSTCALNGCMFPQACPNDRAERIAESQAASVPPEPPTEFRCNGCGASSKQDAMLWRSVGYGCPYCGEGVIQEVERISTGRARSEETDG